MSRATAVRYSAVTALLLIGFANAGSQACTGHSSWQDGRARVGANYLSYPASQGSASASKYGADVGYGLSTGLFGSVALMRMAFDDDPYGSSGSSTGTNVAATIGYPLLTAADKTYAFCPT